MPVYNSAKIGSAVQLEMVAGTGRDVTHAEGKVAESEVGAPATVHGAQAGGHAAGEEGKEGGEKSTEEGVEGEGGEEKEEHEEKKESIFALEENFSKNALTGLLILLILITIGYEQMIEFLESHVFSEGIANRLLQKMARELAILGFVSFTATVLMQFVELGDMEVLFEYAHVLLFATAIMYVKEIALVARIVRDLKQDFRAQDESADHTVLRNEKTLWTFGSAESEAADGGFLAALKRGAASLLGGERVDELELALRRVWRSSTLNARAHHLIEKSNFKAS